MCRAKEGDKNSEGSEPTADQEVSAPTETLITAGKTLMENELNIIAFEALGTNEVSLFFFFFKFGTVITIKVDNANILMLTLMY